MNIELSKLNDGRIFMVSDQIMPDIVKRVEYYREQRLFMLVWHDTDMEELLMHHEVPIDFAMAIERSPNVIISTLFQDQKPVSYKAPLVKVGDIC